MASHQLLLRRYGGPKYFYGYPAGGSSDFTVLDSYDFSAAGVCELLDYVPAVVVPNGNDYGEATDQFKIKITANSDTLHRQEVTKIQRILASNTRHQATGRWGGAHLVFRANNALAIVRSEIIRGSIQLEKGARAYGYGGNVTRERVYDVTVTRGVWEEFTPALLTITSPLTGAAQTVKVRNDPVSLNNTARVSASDLAAEGDLPSEYIVVAKYLGDNASADPGDYPKRLYISACESKTPASLTYQGESFYATLSTSITSTVVAAASNGNVGRLNGATGRVIWTPGADLLNDSPNVRGPYRMLLVMRGPLSGSDLRVRPVWTIGNSPYQVYRSGQWVTLPAGGAVDPQTIVDLGYIPVPPDPILPDQHVTGGVSDALRFGFEWSGTITNQDLDYMFLMHSEAWSYVRFAPGAMGLFYNQSLHLTVESDRVGPYSGGTVTNEYLRAGVRAGPGLAPVDNITGGADIYFVFIWNQQDGIPNTSRNLDVRIFRKRRWLTLPDNV